MQTWNVDKADDASQKPQINNTRDTKGHEGEEKMRGKIAFEAGVETLTEEKKS